MKKLCLTLLLTFSMSAWQTPIDNKEVCRDPRVAVYIPARIGSTRISQKLLQPIDGQSIIKRTYDRAKFIRRANRVCVITNTPDVASIIGEEAQFIDKEYVNGDERICDAFFNHSDHKEEIIVNVQGDEPYLEPDLVDYAIQKFQENESDPTLGAVFLHYELSPEEAAQPSRIKVVVDQHNRLLYGSRSVIPYGNCPRYFGRLGIMVYRADALKQFWKTPRMPLEISEDLHWIRLLEMGYTIKSFEVGNHVERDVNSPQDMAILSEKYSKPRIFLTRSGSFSQHFIEKTNTLWPLREGDIVCRCKTNGTNLELFNERVDYGFFRGSTNYVDAKSLKSKRFTAQPTDTSIAIVELYNLPNFCIKKFCAANGFQQGEVLDRNWLANEFTTSTGIPYNRHKPKLQPSLGFMAIAYFRHYFPDHLIVLCDFTFQGNRWHTWHQEMEYALRLEKEGDLIRLLEKVQTKSLSVKKKKSEPHTA